MEDSKRETLETPQEGGVERVTRKPRTALFAIIGSALCLVVGIGAFFAVGSLDTVLAKNPAIVAPAPAQNEPDGAIMPTVTDESGEIVADDGMSVNVEVYEGEIPESGDIIKE